MMSILEQTFTVAVIFFLNFELYCCTCGRAEYETSGECCPMCSPGNRVYRHCTEFTSTTCMPCVDLTYTDEPNGLSKCISCTVCDMGAGLRVKTPCTRISNTVCEPLEGFYCIDEERGSCRQAVEHTQCKPGQYIKQKGTAVSDVECAVCPDGTYSNGSLQICQLHTKCEDLGLVEKTRGTNSFDVECGPKTTVVLIAVIIVIVVAIVLAVPGALFFIKRCCPAEVVRLPVCQTNERDTSQRATRTERNMCVYNHSGHSASPVENGCGYSQDTPSYTQLHPVPS